MADRIREVLSLVGIESKHVIICIYENFDNGATAEGAGPRQRPSSEQVCTSNLHWSRPESTTSTGAGIRELSLREQT